MIPTLKAMARRLLKTPVAPQPAAEPACPLYGYDENRAPVAHVDSLGDDELEQLNAMLDWKCFTADSKGRRFGKPASTLKRMTAQTIPDPRILMLDERFGLSRCTVTEFGCFEGVHTVALARRARKVIAVDSRIENVVKTVVRCAFYECHPTAFRYDLEQSPLDADAIGADVLHHVGVLYHLTNPVRHLLDLGKVVRVGMMLDTHIAAESEATDHCEVGGRRYAYKRHPEGGRGDVFSGMRDHAKWLTLETICALLTEAGFPGIEVIEVRQERNGPRVLLFARRASA
jgi:tRNA (mo5U34)-methyltransferase